MRRYVANGRLLRVRAGLYAVVARGTDAIAAPVDPYLVATKLAPDGTLAYHAARQFWGKAYSVWQRFHFVTETGTRALRFRGLEFVPVKVPLPIRQLSTSERHVTEQRHAGGTVRVTTLERTLVNVLDVPSNAGGWEEVWRSLEMVEDKHLDPLRRLRPRQPRYLDARRKPGKLVAAWNLIVPDDVLLRTPLWPVERMDSRPVGTFQATDIPVESEVPTDSHWVVFGGRKSRAVPSRPSVHAFVRRWQIQSFDSSRCAGGRRELARP